MGGDNEPASTAAAEPGGMRSLLGDSAAYGLGVAMLPVGLLLATPVIARKVGPVGFGAIDLLTTVLTLASIAAMLGIDAGLSRSYFAYGGAEHARRRAAARTALMSVVAVSTALALVLALAGLLFTRILRTSPSPASPAAIVAAFVLLPFSSSLLIARVTLRLERRRQLYAAVTSTQAAVGVAAAVTLVALGAGPAGYFAGLALGALVALSICLAAGMLAGDGAPIDRSELRTILGYGLPLVPAAFATWVAFAIDRTLLASMRGLSDVGYYALASKLAAPLFLALNAFTIAWIPFILGQPSRRQLELRARTLTAVAAAVGIGLILVLLLAPQAIDVLGGPSFHRSLHAVPGIAIGWLAWGLAFVLATEFMVSRRTKVVGIATSIAAGANVLLNLLLIPPFGFVGASWATAATFVLLAAIYFVIERRSTPAPYRFGRLLLIGLVLAAGTALLIATSLSLPERLLVALGAVAALATIAGTDRSRGAVGG
jgi:O-antigen/teichoic acid export membrane protein